MDNRHQTGNEDNPRKDSGIIFFSDGIPAFEDEKEYYLVPAEEPSPFFYLKSVTSELCLIMADPFVFFPDYEIDLPDPLLSSLGAENNTSNLMVFSIITVEENPQDSTANLLAPVVINAETRQGLQFIPQKTRYTTKHPLFGNMRESMPASQGGR